MFSLTKLSKQAYIPKIQTIPRREFSNTLHHGGGGCGCKYGGGGGGDDDDNSGIWVFLGCISVINMIYYSLK